MNAGALLGTVLVACLIAAGVRYRAVRYRDDSRAGPATTTAVRRLHRWGALVGWAGGVAVGLAAGTPATGRTVVATVLPGLSGPATAIAGAALAVSLPAVLAVAAVRIATLPIERTVERVPLSYRAALRFEVERSIAAGTLFVLAVGLVTLLPAGWPRVGGAVLVGGLGTAATPAWLAVSLQSRRPTEAERAVVSDALPDDIDLLLLDDWTHVGSAVAAGVFPGTRYVFLTAALFDTLSPEELQAVVAHEVGHHRHHHVAIRYGLLVGAVGPLLAILEFVPDLLAPALVLAVPYALLALAVLRRTEWTADAYTVEQGYGDSLADALETLVRRGAITSLDGHASALLAVHPPLADRIARARGR